MRLRWAFGTFWEDFGTIRKTFGRVWCIKTVFPVISNFFHPLSAEKNALRTEKRTDGRTEWTDPLREMRGRVIGKEGTKINGTKQPKSLARFSQMEYCFEVCG